MGESRERGEEEEEEKGVRGDDEESGYMMQRLDFFIGIGGAGRIVTWIAIKVDVIGCHNADIISPL